MALPQRKLDTRESPNTYQYQVRNAQKIERRKSQLNTDFQYLNDQNFAENSNDDRLLSSENPTLRANEERAARREAANEARYNQPEPEQQPNQIKKNLNRASKVRGLLSLSPQKMAIKIAIKARSTVISIAIVSWGMTVWYPQFIFALISVVFLGILGASDAVINSNFVTAAAAWLVDTVVGAVTEFVTGTAVSVGDIGTAIFIILYMVAFAIGLTTLLIASFQYMAAMMHPLSGEQMGMKYGAFLIAVLGYATPFLNLFPWFLIFVAVVWKYPK